MWVFSIFIVVEIIFKYTMCYLKIDSKLCISLKRKEKHNLRDNHIQIEDRSSHAFYSQNFKIFIRNIL